jgi:2,3,4,5-tetrahydropyridine-2-carboxylate N-succinyltransferase
MSAAWGVGIATVGLQGEVLDVRFRALGWGESVPTDSPSVTTAADADPDRGVALRPVSFVVDTSSAPSNAADVYLRLHLLSHRLAAPPHRQS